MKQFMNCLETAFLEILMFVYLFFPPAAVSTFFFSIPHFQAVGFVSNFKIVSPKVV